jgi:phosphoribosylamine---glycine ligase
MNILIIGSGGREHAFSQRLSLDPIDHKIIVLPGNEGMKSVKGVTALIGESAKLDHVLTVIEKYAVELVVIGPEAPLASGMADELKQRGIATIGPKAQAAKLESSKAFSKDFMKKYNIPTARYETYHSYEGAMEGLSSWDMEQGIAIKVDGLAAGKGVVVTNDLDCAKKALHDFMVNPEVNIKTNTIVIEEKLEGKEVSYFAFCHGENFLEAGFACDHKRLKDGDQGPNTGGMGGYTPLHFPTDSDKKFIRNEIVKPTLKGMIKEGTPYEGILFVGLMVTDTGPKVIEYNVRFGDPEAQILLPLIEGNLSVVLKAMACGEYSETLKNDFKIKEEFAHHVVMTSKGYPSIDKTPMLTGQQIHIPSDALKNNQFLYYAGVKGGDENQLVNSGGRVLGVTTVGTDMSKITEETYSAIRQIQFEGAHWREDIGTQS